MIERSKFRYLCPLVLVLMLCGTTHAWAMGEESFGNTPLNPENYGEWKGAIDVINDTHRVYSNWVNGNEHFYFSGDTDALNVVLTKFIAIEAKAHDVVLRPGPGVASSFDGKKTTCDWSLHVVGGIAGHMVEKEGGGEVWDMTPTMTVYIGGGTIGLDKLKIPEGITLVGVADLRQRYLKGLQSKNKQVRGYAADFLTEVDALNKDNVAPVAALLNDDDSWVRQFGATTLGRMGKNAESALPALKEALAKADGNSKPSFQSAIDAIGKAVDTSAEAARQAAVNKEIQVYIDKHKGNGK